MKKQIVGVGWRGIEWLELAAQAVQIVLERGDGTLRGLIAPVELQGFSLIDQSALLRVQNFLRQVRDMKPKQRAQRDTPLLANPIQFCC